MNRVYYMDNFGEARDFWDNEDPLIHFPWQKDKTNLVLLQTISEDNYYLSRIPQEFHKAADSLAWDQVRVFGEPFTTAIKDIVEYLVPCIEQYRSSLLEKCKAGKI